MKKVHVSITYLLLIQVIFVYVQCQPAYEDESGVLREVVTDPKVGTVQLYREGWPLSYPVMRMQGDVDLVLEFDELGGDGSDLYYQVIHCNADWTRSDLIEQEFLEGYSENPLPGGEPSFNTYTNYLHYTLHVPNENTRLLVSGNYLLVVYRNYDPEDVILSRRFMITESSVSVGARAGSPVYQQYQGCCQEVTIGVEHSGVDIRDPYSECTAMICQNGLWDLAIGPLDPYMVNGTRISYENPEELIFPGGNEFRFFDTKNTHTPTYYVQSIDFLDPWFHFRLKADSPNPAHVYLSKEDINGRYHIESDGGRDPGVDADYTFVHFQLDMPFPLDGSVFIAGALTNWQFNDLNRMRYDEEKQAYVHSLLLKQGVYNYRYLFLPAFSGEFDMAEIEASFRETENEYLVLFYHRPPGTRYDRLLGHQVIHSQ